MTELSSSRLVDGDSVLAQVLHDVAAHREGVRRDAHHPHVLVVLHEIGERASGAAAAQVPHQADGLAVDSAPLLEASLERVDVQQRLGGMLVLAAARIDDRNRPPDPIHQRRGLRRHPCFTGAHDDDVDVGAERPDAVLEALALDLRRRGRIPDLARADPEQVAGVVEGEKRPGGRLGEVEHRPLVRKQRLQ